MNFIRTFVVTAVALAGSAVFAAIPSGLSTAKSGKAPESLSRFIPEPKNAHSDAPRTISDMPKMAPNLASAREASEATAGTYGFLYFFSDTNLKQGFYQINTPAPNTYLWTDYYTDNSMVLNSGWIRNGNLCGLNIFRFMGGVLFYGQVELNIQTGELLDFHQLTYDANDMTNVFLTTAYRVFDDKVYGYGYSDDGESFGFNCAPATDIDQAEKVINVPFEQVCIALTYNAQDDLFYGVNTQGKFVSVTHEGVQTEIFPLNVGEISTYISGLAYNPMTKNYVWNACFADGSTAMYEIDPVAKTATKIGNLGGGEEFIFMVNTTDNVESAAPAAATITAFDFAGTATTGSVSCMMPSQTYAGNPLSGTLTWRLLVDGEQISSGSAQPGEQVVCPVESVSNDAHTFAITAEKDGLVSLPVVESRWIGADYPQAPANLELTETKLTWSPVTASVHNGYIDYSQVEYKVWLNDQLIGTTAEPEIDINLPQGQPYKSYTAYVTANYLDKESETSTSNFITYGDPLKLDPSIHYRPEEKELELFKIINADGKKDELGNDKSWRYTEDMGFPSFASGFDGDDWLIFPPIDFNDTSEAYAFEMEAGLVHDSDPSGTIAVYIGKNPTPEAMTQEIIAPYHCEHMRGDILKEYFAVREPGTYYIAIRCITGRVSFHVSDIDIARTDRSAFVPTGVTELTAVPGADGALNAQVSFKMPTTLANGNQIAADEQITATVTVNQTTPGINGQLGEQVSQYTVSGTPGSLQSLTVTTAQNYNRIAVACDMGSDAGSIVSTVIYTGVVIPYIVNNLKAEVSEDNMSMKLTWDPPTEGEDEGPIGNDFLYTIWYYNSGWEFGDDAGWNSSEYTYTLPEGADLQWVRLGVMAYNEAGQSYHISGVIEVIGTPYSLPMDEKFPNYMETYDPVMVLSPSAEYTDVSWLCDDPATVLSPIFANSSNVAFIGFANQGATNVKTRLSLPKFSTLDTSDVTFTIDYYGGFNGSYYAPMKVLYKTFGMAQPAEVASLPEAQGWTQKSSVLPAEASGKNWVELYLDASFADDQHFAIFSGYSISGVSGVNDIDGEKNQAVFSSAGMLHVVGFAGENLSVFTTDGKIILTREGLADATGVALRPGVYMVTVGKNSYKIAVK